MGNNKKSQRARQRKSKDEYLASLKSAATSVTDMLTYMPGLNTRTLDMEKVILAAPDYNCECIDSRLLTLQDWQCCGLGGVSLLHRYYC